MKKLSKLKLKEFAVMNDSEMKSVVGGYDPYETGDDKVCAHFSCECSKGISPTSGSQEGRTWRMSCSTDQNTMVGMISNHCINGEGGCYKVYKDNTGYGGY